MNKKDTNNKKIKAQEWIVRFDGEVRQSEKFIDLKDCKENLEVAEKSKLPQ